MELDGIERQRHFLHLAAVHGEDFKSRVTQHDRENSFPFENVDAMKASGYTNMTVPSELGGGGVSVLDFALAQGRFGPRRRTHGDSREYASARSWSLR